MVESTQFPDTACTKDLETQKKMIREQWTRFYPEVDYDSIKTLATAVPNPDTPSGEAAATPYDPLWGETLPDNMRTEWEQPHLSAEDPAIGDFDATARGEFMTTVQLHARVQREAKDTDLKRWGFDKVRDILIMIPVFLAEEAGVAPLKPGDKFTWSGDEYDVQDANVEGWWMNTDIRVYYVLNCEHRRKGS